MRAISMRGPRRTRPRQRSDPTAQFRTYQVIAGMPTPTYIIFSSVAAYGEFDQAFAERDEDDAASQSAEQATLRNSRPTRP
jgi:hypothetical protein